MVQHLHSHTPDRREGERKEGGREEGGRDIRG